MLFQRIYSLIYYGNESSPNSHYEKFILTGEVKCIDDEIPFELPKGWEWCRLGEVALVTGGYAFSSESLKSPQGIRVIRISDFNEQGWVNKSIVRYDGEDIASRYEIHINDLLLAMTGGTVGKSFFVQEVPEKMYLNQRVAIIRSTSLLPEYINIHLKSLFIIDLINSIKNSTNDNISMRDITSFPFPLPPLAEQQRIVAKIEELMSLVELYGKAQSELEVLNTNIREQFKKSILQYAIEGKLVPQCEEDGTAEDLLQEIQAEKQRLYAEGKLKKKDLTHSTIFRGEDNKYYEKTILTGEVKCIDDEIPFELPNGWEWCRLGEVALVTGGYAFSSESLKSPQGIRVIRISDFNEQGWVNKSIVRYDGEDIASRYEIHINDLLLAMTGGTVGKSFFVQEVPEKMYLNQRVAIIRSTSLLPEYINVHLKSLFIIDLINSIKNSTNDNISMRDITSFTFPLPPLAEQQRIVDKIKLLFDRLK